MPSDEVQLDVKRLLRCTGDPSRGVVFLSTPRLRMAFQCRSAPGKHAFTTGTPVLDGEPLYAAAAVLMILSILRLTSPSQSHRLSERVPRSRTIVLSLFGPRQPFDFISVLNAVRLNQYLDKFGYG